MANTNTFRGYLKSVDVEDGEYGQSVKFIIDRPGGNGMPAWYQINEKNGGKYGRLKERLTQMGLYNDTDGIIVEDMIDKEFEWESIDYKDVGWNGLKCKEKNCNIYVNTMKDSQIHSNTTGHKRVYPRFLLPVKMISGEPPRPPPMPSEPRSPPSLKPKEDTKIQWNRNPEDVVLQFINQYGSIPQVNVVDELTNQGYARGEIVMAIAKMKRNNVLIDKNGLLTTGK